MQKLKDHNFCLPRKNLGNKKKSNVYVFSATIFEGTNPAYSLIIVS